MRITKYSVQLVREKAINYDLGNERITNPHIATKIVNHIFNLENQCEEHLVMLALDTKNRVVGIFDIHTGSISSSIISTKSILTRALLCNAKSIMIFHNHPSGIVEPSNEDILITRKLAQASNLLDITLLDHIIIGEDDNFYSINSHHRSAFSV